MSFYDIVENPQHWVETGLSIEIENPWRHFWNWKTPRTITAKEYEKPDGKGGRIRMAFYKNHKHMLGFSLP